MKTIRVLLMAGLLTGTIGLAQSYAARNYEKSDLTAFFLSATMPGVGEWYNSDFEGNFPIAECITGYICPCIQLSSMIDAVAGDTSVDNIRIDFWSSPHRK